MISTSVFSPQDNRAIGEKLISVIICSIDETKFAAVSNNLVERLKGEPYEIIRIHDAKSLCEGYNRGARQSSGSILIFCHDDIEIVSPDFSHKIRSHLERYDMIGVAGTSRLANFEWSLSGHPHIHGVVTHIDRSTNRYVMVVLGAEEPLTANVEALDGLFIATNKQVWEKIPFDEKTFDGFHGYDLDFSYTAYLSGYRIAVCSDIGIIHQSIGRHDDNWYIYRTRFMEKHRKHIYRGEVGRRELGAIYIENQDEILEMMQPHILRHVTADIRALAARKGQKATHPSSKERFWRRLTGWLAKKKVE